MTVQLQSPQELAHVVNTASAIEAAFIFLTGLYFLGRWGGFLKKQQHSYLAPLIGIFGSLALFAVLLRWDLSDLTSAWRMLAGDPRFRPHLWIASILGAISILGALGLRLRQDILIATLPLGFLAIGVLLLAHPHAGAGDEVARAMFVHRIAGAGVIVAILAHAAGVFVKRWHTASYLVTGALLVLSSIVLLTYREPLS